MPDGLAVAAYRPDVLWGELLLCEKCVYALGGQFNLVIFSNGTAGNFVRAAGAQAEQFGA